MPTNPVAGAPAEAEAQGSYLATLQSAATADGNGTTVLTDGYNGAQYLELQKTGAGTTNLNLEGSYDGITWYSIGYQQVDAITNPARITGPIVVGAGAVSHVYQILDLYIFTRARLSGSAGAISVLARLYAVPV